MEIFTAHAPKTRRRNEIPTFQTFNVILHQPEQPILLIFQHRSGFSDDDLGHLRFDEVVKFPPHFSFTSAFAVKNRVAVELNAILMQGHVCVRGFGRAFEVNNSGT